jgi:hypothetical protein
LNIEKQVFPQGLEDALIFPVFEALFDRRSRRFSLGASIPDGLLTYTSCHKPLPLTELEQLMVLAATGGNNG